MVQYKIVTYPAMQDVLKELTHLLGKDEQLVSGGKLLKNKITELALNLDRELLRLLLSHAAIKKYFFEEVEGIFVFDKIKFQQFINSKSFLPDSYTAFKNKIGLTGNDSFISNSKEVVLAWPYKDAVLEGGQTREDAKRNELFWNETIAPNAIDRLLQPKVFTNFTSYSANGKQKINTISPTDNLIIRGNNLLALHSLKKVFAGKVKLIYIDPPYNTGSDAFLYNDRFNHATWLTFMKNRLEVAWQLLAPDGCLFVQTDDTEAAYLKVLCDEVLGRVNFKEAIVIKSSTESGVNAINVKRGERLFKVKEHILFYAKNPSFRFIPFYTKAEYNLNYKYEVVKEGEQYTVKDISKLFFERKLNGRKAKEISANETNVIQKEFIQYAMANAGNIYSLEKNIKKAGEKFKAFAEKNKSKGVVEEFINSSGDKVLIYDGGVLVPLRERIISEGGQNYFGVLASDLWVDIGTTAATEGGIVFSNGKKPEKLLKRIIEMTTKEGDLVLDYHLGSGTTAAVAHKLNRRYIGIEQLDYGENDSTVRLQNVIRGDATGISKTV
ncbi:MAG TPA: site-specific DNA-methyltransferase, partial [Chitinophagaceae bacterium]|nr:site-specific DNA-methyltransferase [Chitinophagaceae bacterium]